ncbi:hypothetical protein FA15DRAFT_355933 [Coprinopsis marcescibilis]|uniref:Uncharacterized protein n=1 Tax=Coprinopsis marcescibilis TaxID=230819 RepID=A0A5C3KC29_COPMA|nr:hypothetical protein FA15DRAFT_355933 [Coprinopsis marcescibilis]
MYQSHFDGVNDRHEAISRSMNFSHTSNQTSVSRRLGIPTAAATVDYGVTTRKFVGGPDYVHLALYELRRCFSFIPFSYLQHQFQAHHYLYAPTYLFMLSEVQEMQRTTQPLMPDPLIVTLDLTIQYTSADSDNRVLFDAEFEAERNWLATHLISTRGRNRSSKQYPVTQRHDILENSRCEACFTNANSDAIARCPSGHTFCHLCIFNRIKALELNSSQLDVICLKSSCHSPFSKGVLRQILPYEPMERYQRFLRPHPQSHPHPHPEPSRQDMHKVTARPVLCKLEEVDGYDRALLSSTKRTPPTLPSINTSIIPPRLSMSLPNTPRAAVDTDALRKLDKHAVRPYSASPGDNKKQELPAVIRCRTQPLRGKSTPPLGRVRFNSVGLDRRHSAPSVVRPSPYPTRRERQPHRRAGTCTPTQSAAPSLPNPAAVSDAVADGHAPGNSVVVSPIPEDSSCKNPLLRPGNLSLEPWYPLNQQAQPVTRDYTLSGSGSQITGHSSSLQILHYHPGGVRSDLFVVTRGHE